MNNPGWDTPSKAGMAGGLLCTIATSFNSTDLLKTAVLSAIGAIVSFSVSMGCKALVKRWRR